MHTCMHACERGAMLSKPMNDFDYICQNACACEGDEWTQLLFLVYKPVLFLNDYCKYYANVGWDVHHLQQWKYTVNPTITPLILVYCPHLHFSIFHRNLLQTGWFKKAQCNWHAWRGLTTNPPRRWTNRSLCANAFLKSIYNEHVHKRFCVRKSMRGTRINAQLHH